MNIKIELIEDWKQAWKYISMWAMGAPAAFIAAYAVLPQKFQDSVPQNWILGATALSLLVGMAGRVVKQGTPDASK